VSVAVLSWVWDCSPVKGARRLVLLALADHADDETWSCWPSVRRIAAKTQIPERSVRRLLGELKEAGAIEVQAGAGSLGKASNKRQRTNRYTIVHDPGHSVIPDAASGMTQRQVDPGHSVRDTPDTRSAEPSVEPSGESSSDEDEDRITTAIKILARRRLDQRRADDEPIVSLERWLTTVEVDVRRRHEDALAAADWNGATPEQIAEALEPSADGQDRARDVASAENYGRSQPIDDEAEIVWDACAKEFAKKPELVEVAYDAWLAKVEAGVPELPGHPGEPASEAATRGVGKVQEPTIR